MEKESIPNIDKGLMEILKDKLHIDPKNLKISNHNPKLEQIGLDSLAVVEFISELEEYFYLHYSRNISDHEVTVRTTLQEVVNLIKAKMQPTE